MCATAFRTGVIFRVLLAAASFFFFSLSASAQTYSFATIDAGTLPNPLQFGNIGTQAVGLNNGGEALLTFTNFDPSVGPTFQAFLRDTDGTLLPVSALTQGASNLALSKSRIVATSGSGGIIIDIVRSGPHPTAGAAATFNVGADGETALFAVNDLGEILGTFTANDESSPTHTFILDKNKAIAEQFDIPGLPAAMNNFRDIVGNTNDGFGYLFDRQRTGQVQINCPGAFLTSVASINDKQDISGSFIDSSFITHAFVWTSTDRIASQNCTAIDGAIPGAINVAGMNNAGQIAGTFTTIVDSLFAFHGYAATPFKFDVDSMRQTNPDWKDLPYAFHVAGDTDGTIGRKGCALTALTMASKFNAISNLDVPTTTCEHDPPNSEALVPATPKNANCVLRAGNGYSTDSDISWGNAARSVASAAQRKTPGASQLVFVPQPQLSSISCSSIGACQSDPAASGRLLIDIFERGQPVIVGVRLQLLKDNGALRFKPAHYVLVTGVDVSGATPVFRTNDPAGGTPNPRHPDGSSSGGVSLNDYQFYIDCTNEPRGECDPNHRGITVPFPAAVFQLRGFLQDPADLSSVTVSGPNNVDLLVTNPEGARTGFDRASLLEVDEIPQSAYFLDSLDDDETGDADPNTTRAVLVSRPGDGKYKIDVEGIQESPFTITVSRIKQDGTFDSDLSFSGVAAPGLTSSFEFNFQGASSDVTPPVTTASPIPAPNAAGWNNSDVTIQFSAVDSEPGASGVQSITVNASGAQTTQITAPGGAASLTVSAEGTTVITYFATDNAGNHEPPRTFIVKLDKTAPAISGLPSGCTLWPPNGKFVTVAAVSAADVISGLVFFDLTATSNEPADPANSDIIITGSGLVARTVQLRAKRLGNGTGRIYQLTATATDVAGNMTSQGAICMVPHDQGKK